MTELLDENILQIVLRWDEQSFRILYKEYYKILVTYGVQITGNRVAAEDHVQELFSTLYEQTPHFLNVYTLRSYLYNTIRNKSLMYLRHKQVENGYFQNILQCNPEYEIDNNGEEGLFKEEFYRHLSKAVDQLPARQRELFLFYMEGKKNREIAKIMNISIETVKTQKKRAIASVRTIMKKFPIRFILFFVHFL